MPDHARIAVSQPPCWIDHCAGWRKVVHADRSRYSLSHRGTIECSSFKKELCMSCVLALLLLTSTTFARDNGQWSGQSVKVRQWFQSLMQPDNPFMSCCGEADAFEADVFDQEDGHWIAVITDGKGVLANGTRFIIPDGKM